jgi:hypothetical protein
LSWCPSCQPRSARFRVTDADCPRRARRRRSRLAAGRG